MEDNTIPDKSAVVAAIDFHLAKWNYRVVFLHHKWKVQQLDRRISKYITLSKWDDETLAFHDAIKRMLQSAMTAAQGGAIEIPSYYWLVED